MSDEEITRGLEKFAAETNELVEALARGEIPDDLKRIIDEVNQSFDDWFDPSTLSEIEREAWLDQLAEDIVSISDETTLVVKEAE